MPVGRWYTRRIDPTRRKLRAKSSKRSHAADQRAGSVVAKSSVAVLRQATERRTPQRQPGATGVQIGESSVRAKILEGAAAVFAQSGARSASVEDILRASGISRRTFYRFYQNKEDVLVELYRLGTEALLDACRVGVSQETDPLLQVQRCIDAHLRNARALGRLVFVLGGEAHRHESPLHARRMEVHEKLRNILLAGASEHFRRVDPLLYRGMTLAMEGLTRMVLEAGDDGRNVTTASIERARRVMTRIATAVLAGAGPGVAPLPQCD